MRIRDGVPETAAALRTRYGKEMLNVSEAAEALGVCRQTIINWGLRGWIGTGTGKRISVETLARQIVG